MLLGLWVAIGALVASAPGVQAEEGRALRVTDDTARHLRYTSRAKREADVSLSHRCTMEHPLHHGAPRCDGCYHPETTVKASPHRHKWMLSHGAPTDPSDPWNFHAAPVSPRQNG
jgi:hypothetical protein